MGAGRPVHRRAPLVLLLLAFVVASAARAQQDTGLTAVVLQVDVDRGPSTTLMAIGRDPALFLPVRLFLDLLGLRVGTVVPDRRLAGTLQPGDIPFVFETDVDTLVRGGVRIPFPSEQAVWRDGELYVTVALIEQLLEVPLRMDWSEMVLRVSDADQLPAVARLAREERRAVLLRPTESPAEAVLAAARRTPLAGGAVLDWAWTSATRSPFETSTLQLGLGAQVLGGGLEVQHVRQWAPGGDAAETRWQWSTAWPENAWLRQARLGEGMSGGERPRLLRGAMLSNAPFLRSAQFGMEVVGGRYAAGWEVESYRGGVLVGYAAADTSGRFRLEMPVSYGPNPIDIEAYGPHGEVVRRSRAVLVPQERLPSGRVEYTIAGGTCVADPCRQALLGDLRVGVSPRFTMQLGSDAFWRDSLPGLWHPWALVSAAPTVSLNILAEVVHRGLLRGRFDFDPGTNFHLDVSWTRYDTTVSRPLVGSAAVRDQASAALFWRPGQGERGPFFVQASASRSSGFGVTRDFERLAATWRLGGIRSVLAGMRTATRPSGGAWEASYGADASVETVLRGPGRRLRGTFARVAVGGIADRDSFRIARASAALGRQLRSGLHADVEVSWLRGRRGVGLDLTLSTALPGIRAVSRNSVTADAGVQGMQLFEGSLLWDAPRRRLDVGNGNSVGRGGIAGVVFQDLDGDGVQDRGEPGLPDLVLRVGSFAVTTDSAGRFTVRDLVPFEPTVLELDTISLGDPTLVAAEPRLRVRPSPNGYGFVAVAVLQAGEVGGRVRWEGREHSLSGLRVVLRDQEHGKETAVTTFSDGEFYAMGLRPGAYWVFVDLQPMLPLGVTSQPVSVTIGRGTDNRVEGVALRIESTGPPQ